MKKLILVLISLLMGGFVHAEQNDDQRIRFEHPTEVIALLNSSISSLKKELSMKFQGEILSLRSLGDDKIALIKVPHGFTIASYVKDLKSSPQIQTILPNYVYQGEYREFSPNDPEFSKQNHHAIMKNPESWDMAQNGQQVIVAVTDDGFKLDHEDLVNSWHRNPNEIPDNGIDDDQNGYIDDVVGYDFNEQDNDPMSDSSNGSHGTHVAGIIAAGFNNGVGVSGFGANIKVMPIKFYGKNDWTSSMVLESYIYAANNGAKILTTSYYIDNFTGDQAYLKALDYAYQKGLILFNSAGNGNVRQSKRTAFKELLLVASTKTKKSWRNKVDQKSKFSNYGRGVDVSAPGDPIHSTGRSLKYVEMSGTSMASPNAAGAAALIWSHFPELTREQVVARLIMGSDNLNSLNSKYMNLLGSGRVNTKNSISDLGELPPVRVIEARVDQKLKQLKIHLWGVLKPSSVNSRGGIILKRSKGPLVSKEMKLVTPYKLGTNELTFSLPEKGQYQLTILADRVVDPFGRELDGDNDGQSGGNFQYSFEIR